MKKYIPLTIILLVAFSAMLISTYLQQSSKKSTVRLLPVMGNKSVINTDTIYHTVAAFSFTNQLGETITEENVTGKNYVAEYFFTTCQSICPVMNDNMMKVAKAFEHDTTLKILSHTVKPEEDSVPALLVYANEHKANPKNWWFLTGDKKELYSLARKSYLMNNEEGNGDADDFIHTQLFALVDQERRIRGFYDGTNDADVEKLIKDIHLLKEEQRINFNTKK
jgi:protein SCO1/2